MDNFANTPPKNILRTLVQYTAQSISDNIQKFCNFTPSETKVIVSGGGVHHPILMETLKLLLAPLEVVTSEFIKIKPDMKESLLMAVLAVSKINGLSANMPSVTGAKELVELGQKYVC